MEDLKKTAKDAAHTLVGLSVLGYQKAQVQSKELARQLKTKKPEIDAQLSAVRSKVETFTHQAQVKAKEVTHHKHGDAQDPA